MKQNSLNKFYALLLLFLLVSIAFPTSGYSFSCSQNSIGIQENSRMLVAPEGTNYEWSFNGKIMAEASGKTLKAEKSGTYTLKFTDSRGNETSETIKVLVKEGKIIRIFTIGDSTVQDYNDGWYPLKGWGQVLPFFFDPAQVSVINKAVGGTSSKSFYEDHWEAVISQLSSGDFVFIQFGINDRARDERRAMGEDFKNYLRNYVNETKAAGAHPVLVSTVRRNKWENGSMYDSYHEHPQLVREVAAEMNVPLVDLDLESKALIESLGKEYSTRYLYNTYQPGEYPNYPDGNNDEVHFQEMGAIELAKIVVEELKTYASDENISQLIPHIKPQHEVKVSRNKPDVGLVTRTTTYPAGLTITVKAVPATGHTFLRWKDAAGGLISNSKIHTFTMGNESRHFIGYFDDEQTEFDCSGEMGGSATIDDCGICSGGYTGLEACTASLQAETVCMEGTEEAQEAGFEGSGYVNSSDKEGTTLTWFMNGSTLEMDHFLLSIRYLNNGSTPLQAKLLLNEEEVEEISFAPTGSDAEWATVNPSLFLNGGSNTLQLVALSEEGLPLIDQFSWSVDYVQAGTGDCPERITSIRLDEAAFGFRVYPNPFKDHVKIEGKAPFHYSISDINGRERLAGYSQGILETGSGLAPGLYLLRITTQKGSFSTKLIKK